HQVACHLKKRLVLGATVTLCLVGSLGPAAAQFIPETAEQELEAQAEQENPFPNTAPSTGVQPFNLQSTLTQAPATTGAPSSPPLAPPVDRPLPIGHGQLSFEQWLLTPQLLVNSFYDTNVHSSATVPLAGPGFHFHPSMLAEYNTGIWYTKLSGNLDSRVYPT